MNTRMRSTKEIKKRIRWKNVRVAYCLKCQRVYSWRTERCPACARVLVAKIERVEMEEQ